MPSPTEGLCVGRWGTVPLGKLILMANIKPSWQWESEEGGQPHHQLKWEVELEGGEGEGGRVEGRQAHFFGWSERAKSCGCPLLLPASLLRPHQRVCKENVKRQQ